MPFTVVCEFPSLGNSQTTTDKAHHGPSITGEGREGAMTATKSFAVNCQNVLESTRFRNEHTSSETRDSAKR